MTYYARRADTPSISIATPSLGSRGRRSNDGRRSFGAPGTFLLRGGFAVAGRAQSEREPPMHGLIYLIGLIVVILAILSFFGLR
jgi:hypothetical protein